MQRLSLFAVVTIVTMAALLFGGNLLTRPSSGPIAFGLLILGLAGVVALAQMALGAPETARSAVPAPSATGDESTPAPSAGSAPRFVSSTLSRSARRGSSREVESGTGTWPGWRPILPPAHAIGQGPSAWPRVAAR